MKTLYDKWNAGESGFTNFGSFQTTILQAYRIADSDNRELLQKAFPFWFCEDGKHPKPEFPQLISNERRFDMLVGAIEGGSNYWYYISNKMCDKIDAVIPPNGEMSFVDRMWKYILAGNFVNIRDIEDTSNLLGSIRLSNMNERELKLFQEQPQHFADILSENDDATTADVWFQYVVMNEVVYG